MVPTTKVSVPSSASISRQITPADVAVSHIAVSHLLIIGCAERHAPLPGVAQPSPVT
jgi:hypothetical protein